MKVLVIGLDAAVPELVFDRWRDRLPNLSKLMENGIYGPMRSTDPPITIPAWYAMMSGQTPGTLGLYGFRHRVVGSYDDAWIANSERLPGKAVWDILSRAGKEVVVFGIPPSYPPYEVKGKMVSCFLTPDINRQYTYPAELADEIEGVVGEYIPDVPFRTEEKRALLEDLDMMTDKRADVIKHLIDGEWDFMMYVEIGLDRVQHAFWRYFDEDHHLYTPNDLTPAIEDYYKFLDEIVGDMVAKAGDDTAVMVVSDHGAKRMKGAFCINEWLMEKGYLVVKEKPDGSTKLADLEIDWSRTKAWGWGGYYARIFLNVEGREPDGIIPPEEYESFRTKLKDEITSIKGPDGEEWDTRVDRPEEVYSEVNGDPPDLMVYLDDLYWRSAGTVGHGTAYLRENDTGPDDAVHDWNGIFILSHPMGRMVGNKRFEGMRNIDVAPTVLRLMEQEIPEMDGMVHPQIEMYAEAIDEGWRLEDQARLGELGGLEMED